MDSINKKVKEFHQKWQIVLKLVSDDNSWWNEYIHYTTPIEIDEVVRTIVNLMDRVRSPKGFEPNFNLAKSYAMTELALANEYLENIAEGLWEQLKDFFGTLNNLLACFHNLIVFSDESSQRELIGNLSLKLSQSLSFVETTKKELSNKLNELNEITNNLLESQKINEEFIKKYEESKEYLANIQEIDEQVTVIFERANESQDEITDIKQTLLKQTNLNQNLLEAINKNVNKVEEQIKSNKTQSEIIDGLLPKGASAGLASSFGSRVEKLTRTRIVWMTLFIISIIGLCGVGVWIFVAHSSEPSDLWDKILYRLPLTAPLIWLGWFSAVQYGNVIRVQEDYAFKEATSKAFAGYRDHMQHLSAVNDESAKTALDLLAKHTIEILAKTPLRIYNKSENDVTMWKTFLNKNSSKSTDENN